MASRSLGKPLSKRPKFNLDEEAEDVVAGSEANHHEFPWIVRIGAVNDTKTTTFCGGSIISPNYVVTAAHCVLTKPGDLFCAVGVHNLQLFINDEEGSRIPVDKVIVHENFKRGAKRDEPINDIALLKLAETLQLGENHVNAIKLPNKGRNFSGRSGMLAGWGRCSEDVNRQSTVLMKKILKLWPAKKCNNHINKDSFDENSLLCVSDFSGAHCYGDSGGPLMVKNRRGEYELAGLVSFGPICVCHENQCYCQGSVCKSGYYVNVAHHIDWIKGHVGKDLNYL